MVKTLIDVCIRCANQSNHVDHNVGMCLVYQWQVSVCSNVGVWVSMSVSVWVCVSERECA